MALPAVNEVTANPRTGSLLIFYDADRLDESEIATILEAGEGPAAGGVKKFSDGSLRQLTAYSMAASLGISLGAILARRKKLHWLAGTVFLGFLCKHLLDTGWPPLMRRAGRGHVRGESK